MIRLDLHTHTVYCDGKNTPAEMAAAAYAAGLEVLGFSGHGYTACDESYCMSPEKTEAYRQEIAALKEQYRGRLRILCGVEQDFFAEEKPKGFDYVIGSVHYVRCGDEVIPVDEGAEILVSAAVKYCGGDVLTLAEQYFASVGEVAEKTGADIVGHFDAFCKFNEKTPFFDEHAPRYEAAWKKAADRLLRSCRLFEINTGGIARGMKTVPYPRKDMIDYLRERGAHFLLTSDSHRTKTLCFDFDKYEELITEEDAVFAEKLLLQ